MNEPIGRPTKLTPDIQEKILTVIKLGAYRTAACDFAGISPETLRNWMRRGENEGEGPYVEFAAAIKQAEASACLKALGTIRTAMESQWQAAAWFLERKRPKEWGKRERHELTGKDGGPIRTQVRLGELSPHDRRARLAAFAERFGIEEPPQAAPPAAPPAIDRRIEGPPDAEGAGRSEPA